MSKRPHDVPYATTGALKLERRARKGSFVWDHTSGMWYDEKSQFYFEGNSKLYAKRNDPQWYKFDSKRKKLIKTDRNPCRRKNPEVNAYFPSPPVKSRNSRAHSSVSLPATKFPNSLESHRSTGQIVIPRRHSNSVSPRARLLHGDANSERTTAVSFSITAGSTPDASAGGDVVTTNLTSSAKGAAAKLPSSGGDAAAITTNPLPCGCDAGAVTTKPPSSGAAAAIVTADPSSSGLSASVVTTNPPSSGGDDASVVATNPPSSGGDDAGVVATNPPSSGGDDASVVATNPPSSGGDAVVGINPRATSDGPGVVTANPPPGVAASGTAGTPAATAISSSAISNADADANIASLETASTSVETESRAAAAAAAAGTDTAAAAGTDTAAAGTGTAAGGAAGDSAMACTTEAQTPVDLDTFFLDVDSPEPDDGPGDLLTDLVIPEEPPLSIEDTNALTKGILCHPSGNAAPRKSSNPATTPSRRATSPRKIMKKPSRRSSFKIIESSFTTNPGDDILDASCCVAECFLVCGVDRLRHPVGLQPKLLHCYPKRSKPVTDLTGVSNFVFPFGMKVDTQPWEETFYYLVLTSGSGEFSYLSTLCFPEQCPPSVTAIICCEELQIQFLQFIQQWIKTQAESCDKPAAESEETGGAAEGAGSGTDHSTGDAPALIELAFNLVIAIHHTVGNLSMPTLRQLVSQMCPEDDAQSHVELRTLGSELEGSLDALNSATQSNADKEAAQHRVALEAKLVEIHDWLCAHLRPVLESFCEAKQLEHLYVCKALVICSEYPFYRFFKGFLNEILAELKEVRTHQQGWLEKWISYLTRDVPVPPLGRLALGTRLRPRGRALTVSLPPPSALPLADFDMEMFFRRLPMNHVVVLFLCALCEVKIIFFSEDPHLLGLAGQTLLSLLYPIKWVCTFIPLLPLKMRGCLGSPAPGIFGTHPRARDGELQDMTIMDLDGEELSLPAFIPLESLVTVPESKLLFAKLSKWAYGDTFSQRHVRLAFADFVTSLLRNYRRYVRPLTDDDAANSMQTAFDYGLFCKQKKDFAEHSFFYESFCQSQMLEAFAQECQTHMSGQDISTDVMFLQSRIDFMNKRQDRNRASFATDTSSDVSEMQLLEPPAAVCSSSSHLARPADPNNKGEPPNSLASAEAVSIVLPHLSPDRFGSRNVTVRDDLQRRLQADSIRFESNVRIVDKVELAVGEVARAGFLSLEFCKPRIRYCKKHHAAHTKSCRKFLSTVQKLYNHTTNFSNSLKRHPAVGNKQKVSEFFRQDPCTSFSRRGGFWSNFVDTINNLSERAHSLRVVLENVISNIKSIIRNRDNLAIALQHYGEMHSRFFEQTKTMYECSRMQRNKHLADLNAKAEAFSPSLHKDGLTKGLLEKMLDIMKNYQSACEKQLRVGADAAAFASYLPVHLQSFDIALKHYRHTERDCLEQLQVYLRDCIFVGVLKLADELLAFTRKKVLPGFVALPDLSKHHTLVGRPDEEEHLSAVQQLEGVFNRWLNAMRATKRVCREGYNLTLFSEQAYQNFLGNKVASAHKILMTPHPMATPHSSPLKPAIERVVSRKRSDAELNMGRSRFRSDAAVSISPALTITPPAKDSPQAEVNPDSTDVSASTEASTVPQKQIIMALNSIDSAAYPSDAESDDGSSGVSPDASTETVAADPNAAVACARPPEDASSRVRPTPPPLPVRQISRDIPEPRLWSSLKRVDTYLVNDMHTLFSALMSAIQTHQKQMLFQLRSKMKTERLRLLEEREDMKLLVEKCQQNFNAALGEAEAQTQITNGVIKKKGVQEKKSGEGRALLECRISGPDALTLQSRRLGERAIRVKVHKSSAFLQGNKEVRPGHLLLKIEDTVVAGMKKQDIKTRLASAKFPATLTLGNSHHVTLWNLESEIAAYRKREEQLMVKLGDAQETLLKQEQSYLRFKRESVALFERLERERVDLILSKMNASARMDVDNLSLFKENSSEYGQAVKGIDLDLEHQPWVDFNRKLKNQQRLLLEKVAPFSNRYAQINVKSDQLRRPRPKLPGSLQSLRQVRPNRLEKAASAPNAAIRHNSPRIQGHDFVNRSTWEISSLWRSHFNAATASVLPNSKIGSPVEGDCIKIYSVGPSAYDKFVALLNGAAEASRRTQHFLDTTTKIEQSLLNNLRKLCTSWDAPVNTAATEADVGESLGPDSSGRDGRSRPISTSYTGSIATESVAEAMLAPCVKGIREFVRVHTNTVKEWCAGMRHAANGLRIFKHAASKLQAAVKSHKDVINNLLAGARTQYEMCEKRQKTKENNMCEQVREFRTRAAKEFLAAAHQSHQTQMAQLLSFGMQRFQRWLHGMHQHVLVPFRAAFETYSESSKRNTDAVMQHMRDALLDPASLQRIKATVCTTIDQTGEMPSDYYSIAEKRTNGFRAARSCAVAHQGLIKQMHESLQKFLQQLWDHAKKVISEKKPRVDNGLMSGLSISSALEAAIAGVYGVAYTTLLRCCNGKDRAHFELRCAGDTKDWDLLPTLSTTRGMEWFNTKPSRRADLHFLVHTRKHKALLQNWEAIGNASKKSSCPELKPSQKYCLLNIQRHAKQMKNGFVLSDQTNPSRPRLSCETANALAAQLKAIRAVDITKLDKLADEGVSVCLQPLVDGAEEEVCTGLQSAFAQFKKTRKAMKFRLDLNKSDNVLPAYMELRDVTRQCCEFIQTLWTEWGRDVECLNKVMELTSSDLNVQDGKEKRLYRRHKKKGNVNVAQESDYKEAKAGAIDAFKSICVRSVDAGASCLDQLTTAEYWFAGSVRTITRDVANTCQAIDVDADVRRVLGQLAITKGKDSEDEQLSDNWDEDSES